MFNLENLVRPNIKALAPYSSARDEFTGDGFVMLDANENPYGINNRYPDPYQRGLKAKLGELKKLPQNQIFIGNGSDQVIDLLFRVFCEPKKDTAAAFDPSYGMYTVSAQINDTALVKIPLAKDFSINKDLTANYLQKENLKLLFVCNPNNPTGNLLLKEQIIWLLQTFKGIVVIDEAYIDFCPEESSIDLLESYPNLIVMQTLSKAWGLAAARIGMAYASPAIIYYLNKVKPPYNVSSLNQKAAINALNNQEVFKKNVQQILDEKQRLLTAFRSMESVQKVYPTASNFLLIQVNNAHEMYAQLKQERLVVRNRDSAVANCLRITVGTPAENDKLIEVLNKLT